MGAVRDHSIIIACIGAGSAIVAAFAKPICDTLFGSEPQPQGGTVAAAPLNPPRRETPPTPEAGTEVAAQSIEGAWKQYILAPDEEDVYLGTFVVSRLRGEYVISPRFQNDGHQSETQDYQPSIGVFDVAYDGQRWTYNTNWGGGEIGNFELKRISPTIFEGEIRVAGHLSNRTRFVKIE
jgi:hypothetical protein